MRRLRHRGRDPVVHLVAESKTAENGAEMSRMYHRAGNGSVTKHLTASPTSCDSIRYLIRPRRLRLLEQSQFLRSRSLSVWTRRTPKPDTELSNSATRTPPRTP